MWLNLAASRTSGDDCERYSQARDELAARMTPQQISEAQRSAYDWKPKGANDEE